MEFQLLLLVTLASPLFASSCPKQCDCSSTKLTVICSDFTLPWSSLLASIPSNARELYLSDGILFGDESTTSIPIFNPYNLPQKAQSFPHLATVHISSVKFDMPLQEDTFQLLNHTEELHVVFSSIESLSDTRVFSGFNNLKLLNLSHNLLKEVNEALFEDLLGLTVLDLSYNRLTKLPYDVFQVLDNLESLHINDNDLEYIHPFVLGNLTSLRALHLDSNALESLHETALPQNVSSFVQLKLQVRELSIGDVFGAEPTPMILTFTRIHVVCRVVLGWQPS